MEKANIVTVAWVGMMGSEPPVIAISLKRSRFSLELIRQTKEFTVNIPSVKHSKETDYCGIVSGRDRNKFDDTGFTAIKSGKISAPIIQECPFNMECKVVKEGVELGQWVAMFGEIVETHVDEDKVDKSNGRIDIGKVDPLVYCAR
jgi:flavin reductase (DIM6/NTAB) family NADH-FMN oxidoreductase RutF